MFYLMLTRYLGHFLYMNQKEYKKYLQGSKENRPKNFFYYRNLAEKILGYKRRAGLTIHHLRNTPEQQYFNDNFYERWGIDFDGKMKYCICITTEEHKKLHALSKETKEKISKSVSIAKTKLTPNQRKLYKQKSDNSYKILNKEKIKEYKHQYYLKHKEKIIERNIQNKQQNKEHYKEYNKQWKLKNKDKVKLAKQKAYLKKKNFKNNLI